MVDTPTPPPPLPDPAAVQATNTALAATGTVANTSAEGLNNYNAAATNLAQNGLQKAAAASTALIPALVGVSEASQRFAATVGAGRINTFANQLDEISKAASRPGVALDALQKAGSGLVGLLGRMGDGSAKTTSIMGMLTEAISSGSKDIGGIVAMAANYAKNFVSLGEEMKVVREATLAQAAASGDLNTVMRMAGENMQNLDRIAQRQQQMWINAQKATGLSRAEIAAFNAELNKVPGVLAQTTSNLQGHNKTNKEFIDTLKLFKASGRDYQAITQDMATAIKTFGTTQKGAVDYTTRMSVVAKQLQIPINDLHNALATSADAFRMFATEGKAGDEMTKNLQNTMAGYIQKLREAGIPQRNAIEMAQHYAERLSDMTIGQKAFLSQMTGGPGGLMGAFQLDKLMDEGKVDQVFGKVQSALRKQFGRIVTTEEAARSQSAAEAMTRQMMILRQGPLGSFAKSDTEARKLLDAMSRGKKPEDAIKDLKKDEAGGSLEAFLKAGNKISQGSQGLLNEILVTLGGAEYTGAAGAARVTEPVLGARTYFRPGEGVGSPEAMERRRAFAATGERPGGATLLETTMKDLKNLPTSLKDTLNALGIALKSGNKEAIQSNATKVQQSIAEYKAAAANLPEEQRRQAMASARALSTVVTSAMQDAQAGVTVPAPTGTPATGGTTAPAPGGPNVPPPTTYRSRQDMMQTAARSPADAARVERQIQDYIRQHPGMTRAAAIADLSSPVKNDRQSGTTPAQTGAAATPFGRGGQPMPVTLAPGSTISVNFVGVCPHCKAAINSTEQGKTVSPQASHR